MSFSDNTTALAEGFHIGSQVPIDDRFVKETLTDLQNYGVNNYKCFTYYDGLHVWVKETNVTYVWREVVSSEIGEATNFTYPNGTLVNGTDYSGKIFNFFNAGGGISSCLFAAKMESLESCSGNNITIKNNLEFLPDTVTYGPTIFFEHTNGGSEIDIITPGITEITRGLTQPIFNIAAESSYVTGSPSNTEWNSIFIDPANYGFSNLYNLSSRSFGTFVDALNGSIGSNIFSTVLIMREISTNKYYFVEFLSWTNTSGGGFSYNRTEILNTTPPTRLVFSDGTTQKTGAPILIEGTNITISSIINAEGENETTISTIGGDTILKRALFVTENGNNGTAQPYNLNKPYANIYNAVLAANNGDVVIVFPGNYTEFGSLLGKNEVDIICLGKGSVSGSGNLFSNLGLPVNVRVFAPHWNFSATGSVVYLTGPSVCKFDFTFNEITASGGPHTMLDLTNTNNFVKLIGNRAYGYIYGLNLRSASNGYFNIKSLESGGFNAIFIRPGALNPQGKAEIYFENLISPSSGIISAQSISAGANYKCNGKIITNNPTFLLLLQGNYGGIVDLNIEMEQPCDSVLFYSNFGAGTELKIKGRYKSKSQCWQIDSTDHVITLQDAYIESLSDNLGYINNLSGPLILRGTNQLKSSAAIPNPFLSDVSKILNQGGSLILDTNNTIDIDAANPTFIYNVGHIYLKNGLGVNFTTLVNTNIIDSNISVL